MDFGSPVRAAPWPGRPPRSPMHGPATAASATAAGPAGAVAIPMLVPALAAPAQGGTPSRSLTQPASSSWNDRLGAWSGEVVVWHRSSMNAAASPPMPAEHT